MKAEVYKAWFLRSRPSGDTSLRVSFLTEALGIIEALYKGGRTPKKKVALQPFTPLWLSLDTRHDRHYVRQVECDAYALTLSGQALFSGLYVNEILYSMQTPQEPSSQLFHSYVTTLEALSATNDRLVIEPILRRFERLLLDISGYGISLAHDAQSGEAIERNHFYQFVPGFGFILSTRGYLGAHILAFSEDKLDDVESLHAAKKMMREAIHHATDGKEIHAKKLFLSV